MAIQQQMAGKQPGQQIVIQTPSATGGAGESGDGVDQTGFATGAQVGWRLYKYIRSRKLV